MDNRKEISKRIIEELKSRNGFIEWWVTVEKDLQEDIVNDIVKLIPLYKIHKN